MDADFFVAYIIKAVCDLEGIDTLSGWISEKCHLVVYLRFVLLGKLFQ